jgi:hypothetical protein
MPIPADRNRARLLTTQVYKWKKLGTKALKANGGVMKTKRLQESVLASIGADRDAMADLKTQMLSAVRLFAVFPVVFSQR